MLGEDPPVTVPAGPLGPDEAQFVIGSRYLLLAPLFGYSLLKLVVPPVPPTETEPPTPIVAVFRDGFQEEVTVAELRERLRDAVQREVDAVQEGQCGLDLRKADEARVAPYAGDAEKA